MSCKPLRHEWKIPGDQPWPGEGASCLCGEATFDPSMCELDAAPDAACVADSPDLVARDIEIAFATRRAGFLAMQELCRRALPFLRGSADLIGVHEEAVRLLNARIAEQGISVRQLRVTANDLLRQRDEALSGWVELCEALGCTEDDDSVADAVRALKSEIALDDIRLAEFDKMLDLLPCAEHGRCIPHATERIGELQTAAKNHTDRVKELESLIADLQSRELTERVAKAAARRVTRSITDTYGTTDPETIETIEENVEMLILSARGSR